MTPGKELFTLNEEDHNKLNQQGNDQDKVRYFEIKFSKWL
jgi:hypothetical protein